MASARGAGGHPQYMPLSFWTASGSDDGAPLPMFAGHVLAVITGPAARHLDPFVMGGGMRPAGGCGLPRHRPGEARSLGHQAEAGEARPRFIPRTHLTVLRTAQGKNTGGSDVKLLSWL